MNLETSVQSYKDNMLVEIREVYSDKQVILQLSVEGRAWRNMIHYAKHYTRIPRNWVPA